MISHLHPDDSTTKTVCSSACSSDKSETQTLPLDLQVCFRLLQIDPPRSKLWILTLCIRIKIERSCEGAKANTNRGKTHMPQRTQRMVDLPPRIISRQAFPLYFKCWTYVPLLFYFFSDTKKGKQAARQIIPSLSEGLIHELGGYHILRYFHERYFLYSFVRSKAIRYASWIFWYGIGWVQTCLSDITFIRLWKSLINLNTFTTSIMIYYRKWKKKG